MKIAKLWFDDGRIFIETDKRDTLSQSLKWYPRLENATQKQREAYRLSPMGIHWDDIDEDVSFESFTYPNEEPDNKLADFFNRHPEINVSKFALRVGIPRSVFASYLCGAKKPSQQRVKDIEKALREMGKELSAAIL
ncbi:MAG: DUF2442 domain-containing protein [Rikenellaceae bacterium]|nr:DUF2442 domain-containing protein [Rikenellaceae bacterium]